MNQTSKDSPERPHSSKSPAPKWKSRKPNESKAAGLMRNVVSSLYMPFSFGFILMGKCGEA